MTPAIVSEFRSATSFHGNGEVELFRSLAQSIVKYSHSTFIDETHGGGVCNVTFDSVTGRVETCEIADLLIISCARKGSVRATFWQVKKQGRSKWVNATTGNEHFDFDGQFNQWDLLSRRPLVSGIGRFQPPSDLLSSFTSASIGSFGVFYQRNSLIELNHSVAQFISCHNPTVARPKMSINGYLGRYYYSNREVIVRPTLESFLDALFGHELGALLQRNEATHRWLVQYARSKVSAATGAGAIRASLDRFLGNDLPGEDVVGHPRDGLSVLIVARPGEA